jgi:hypothetical protein
MENEETEKEQLDEALKIVGDKLCLTTEALIRASNQNTELKTEIEQLNIAGATAVEAAKLFKQRSERAEAEVERLKELLNRAINEIEKTPFNTPKLTAFTAHRLADRYREKMTNTSTKPVESQ